MKENRDICFCTKCGQRLTIHHKYCPNCGSPQESSTPEPAPLQKKRDWAEDASWMLFPGLVFLYSLVVGEWKNGIVALALTVPFILLWRGLERFQVRTPGPSPDAGGFSQNAPDSVPKEQMKEKRQRETAQRGLRDMVLSRMMPSVWLVLLVGGSIGVSWAISRREPGISIIDSVKNDPVWAAIMFGWMAIASLISFGGLSIALVEDNRALAAVLMAVGLGAIGLGIYPEHVASILLATTAVIVSAWIASERR